MDIDVMAYGDFHDHNFSTEQVYSKSRSWTSFIFSFSLVNLTIQVKFS